MRILLILCFFCVSHAIKADEEKQTIQVIQDNVRYLHFPNDKGVVCVGFADTSKICNRLIIPDSILVNGENMPVSEIQGNAFSYRKDLQYVKLPNTLKYIIYNAFSNCENLDSVFIPASVEVIKPTAFDESNLVSITVSPQNPYYDSRDNSHAIIDSKTNELLVGSASSTIPASVTKLREKAFSNRKKLKQITIPKNIRCINLKCFCSCDSLFRVDFEDNSSSESNENGLTIARDAFENCKNLTSIKLPNRLDTIGVYAFYGCERLESIFIPNRVSFIAPALFEGCKSLKSIAVDPNNKIYDSRNNCNAIIKTSTNTLVSACSNTIIPDGIKIIACWSFVGVKIDSVYIPDGVKEIEKFAFNSSAIRAVRIPNSIKEFDLCSFLFCNNLRNIYLCHTVPPIITKIGDEIPEEDMKEILKSDEDDYFVGFKYLRNACIYVPKIAYKKYKKHPIWKQLKIMPY